MNVFTPRNDMIYERRELLHVWGRASLDILSLVNTIMHHFDRGNACRNMTIITDDIQSAMWAVSALRMSGV